MAFGRVCLIGDAAFAVRPHAAAGTAKAAADGWALADALTAGRRGRPGRAGPVGTRSARPRPGAARPVPGYRGSSQVGGTFRPGDQRLIFGLYEPGN